MKTCQSIATVITFLTLVLGVTAFAQNGQLGDYGDAPEGALAYPGTGVVGAFPTCINVGPAGFVYHGTPMFQFLGPMKDFETDGNAGTCPIFGPYDMDECFADPDAGLLFPGAFTIVGMAIVPCSAITGSLGTVCLPGVWGVNLDIHVVNTHPQTAYMNVLMDWNQDGIWAPSVQVNCASPEYILVDFPIPGGFVGPLSALMPPGFVLGGNPGHVWSRFTITEVPIGMPNWSGAGSFEDGESEDYLLLVDNVVPDEKTSWGSLKSQYR